MKYIIKKGLLLLFSITCLFFSCIRKKDFQLDKVKWDEITPAWGLPLINSTLSIDQALNKNTSNLIIQRDPDGFITFIYLDTVYSPDGTVLLEKFKLAIPNIHEGLSLGTIPVLPAPNNPVPGLSSFNVDGTFDFVLDSVESIKRITFKDGSIKIQPKSLIKHKVSFKLTIPGLKNAFGTPFSTLVDLSYAPPTLPTVAKLIEQKLSGYSMVSSGGTNTIAYSIDNLSIETMGVGGVSNPILPTDSITVDISFDGLQLKSIEGKMMPVHLTNVPRGETVINAFDNALSGNISFENPSINFTFENSFGLTPSVRIDTARMQYAYEKPNMDFKVNSVMQIPGFTTINPATTLGKFTPTPTIVISRNTSNIVDVLQGAPNKFVYKIGSIGLSSGNNDAFISDDSQIKINTEVKIPLFGSVDSLIISDTIKNVEMIKADNVDYIEFRAGSENSIPTSVQLQAYFCDTALYTFDIVGKKKYVILDSLVSPSEAGLIVAPGDIEDMDNEGNITKTKINSFSTTIPVSKEKYKRISTANVIIIKGKLFTKDKETKSVKFFTWQTCTFRLAAFAKLRINPGSPEDIINIGK